MIRAARAVDRGSAPEFRRNQHRGAIPHRSERFAQTAQRRIQRQLQQAKVRMLGVVFNDAETEEASGTYAYYYPNGHKRK